MQELIARGDLSEDDDRPHRRPLRRDVTAMAGSVVLVDRDPLYAWFVTEALSPRHGGDLVSRRGIGGGPARRWSRRCSLVGGVTANATAPRGAAAAADTWRRAVLIGWDPRTTPPAGFVALGDKPNDAGDLCALVAKALASAPAGRDAETSEFSAG